MICKSIGCAFLDQMRGGAQPVRNNTAPHLTIFCHIPFMIYLEWTVNCDLSCYVWKQLQEWNLEKDCLVHICLYWPIIFYRYIIKEVIVGISDPLKQTCLTSMILPIVDITCNTDIFIAFVCVVVVYYLCCRGSIHIWLHKVSSRLL